MTLKVVPLQVGSGIQRDGTQFAAPAYVDGQWCRFQYGRPKKMGGYTASFLNAPSISRGMIMQSQGGQTWVISGFNNGLQQWTIGNSDAIGSGPIPIYVIGSIIKGHHSFNLMKNSLNFSSLIYVFWCVSFLIMVSCKFIFFFVNCPNRE